MRNRKGQGSALAGDLPVIIMIVVAVAFFLSTLGYSLSVFEGAKDELVLKRAAVDAANAFLKESAKIDPEDISLSSQFWITRIDSLRTNYGVNVHVSLKCLDIGESGSTCPCPEGDPCTEGNSPPPGTQDVMVKSFPIAIRDTDLFVYPGVISVEIWK